MKTARVISIYRIRIRGSVPQILQHPASQPILGQVREYDKSSQHPHTYHIDPRGRQSVAAASSVEPIIREDSIKINSPRRYELPEQRALLTQ